MAKVSIVMGSDSDLKIMSQAAKVLSDFGIEYEMKIISAHRMPDIFVDYAKSAQERGVSVIIAGAGGAAHLPGMCAALFTLPVIGVPIHTKSLSGVDSLYSIVQMPSGIPVATVAIDGAKNAGLLAVRMLAISDSTLLKKLEDYKEDMKQSVASKCEKLENIGYEEYLKRHVGCDYIFIIINKSCLKRFGFRYKVYLTDFSSVIGIFNSTYYVAFINGSAYFVI